MITLDKLVSYAAIVSACQRGARVAWVSDVHKDGVGYGTLRCVTPDDQGNYARGDDDPETLLVRITTTDGMEIFPPLPELAAKYATAEFVIDPSE